MCKKRSLYEGEEREWGEGCNTVTVIKQIKDSVGKVLQDHSEIKGKCKEYFENLLNEENDREIFESGVENQGLVKDIFRVKVAKVVTNMKNWKSVGADVILVEV